MMTSIPRNGELTPEQLEAKEKMILEVLELLYFGGPVYMGKNFRPLEPTGTVYGGCVRDLINGVIPEDIDIRVRSSNGTARCIDYLHYQLDEKGYTIFTETVEKYDIIDYNMTGIIGNICKKLLELPEFEEFKEHLEFVSKSPAHAFDNYLFDDEVFKKISKIGIAGKFTLEDIFHARACERIIVLNEKWNVYLNIDITRPIDTNFIQNLFETDFSIFDMDVNTLYIADDLQIKSFMGVPVGQIVRNIKDKKFSFPKGSYGCAKYRLDKMISKGYSETPLITTTLYKHQSHTFNKSFTSVLVRDN